MREARRAAALAGVVLLAAARGSFGQEPGAARAESGVPVVPAGVAASGFPAGRAGPAAGAGAVSAPVMTLEEAVRAAVARDPAAVGAEAALSAAEADLLQSRGSLLPGIFVSSGFANSSNERFDQTTGRLVSESYTAQLQGSYEVFSGGRRLAQLRAAGAEVEAAEADWRAQRYRTILATTEAFYAAAAAREVAAAAEQRLERARQQHEFARTRLEVGTATQSDVLRAELELGNAELAVLDARASFRSAALELGRRVGREEEVHPVDAVLPERAPPLPAAAALVERALRGSPSVVAAEAQLRSSRAARLASLTGFLPTVRLTGGYDWFAFQFPPDQQSWSVRVFASLPVFNGFQREAAVQRARAAERAAEARARDAALAVRVAVETAVQDVVLAERRVEISDRAVRLAREDLRVQEERYRIGAATIVELQTSQVALSEAEVSAVRARQELGTAVARLEAILGERIGEG